MPEEVGLHRTLSWHRSRLPPSRMSISNHSTWHTHKRHTQKVLTSKLPRDSNAHITSKALLWTLLCVLYSLQIVIDARFNEIPESPGRALHGRASLVGAIIALYLWLQACPNWGNSISVYGNLTRFHSSDISTK